MAQREADATTTQAPDATSPALQYRLDFERLVTTITTGFINVQASEIDEQINRALKRMGEFFGVDRSYVFRIYDAGEKADNTHEWCAEGVEPQIHTLQGLVLNEDIPWVAGQLRHLHVVHVPRVLDLPSDAPLEKEHFSRQDIKSFIAVPVAVGGTLAGFMGFDSVRAEKAWSQDAITLLRIAGEALIGAMERKKAEEELKRQAQIINQTHDAVVSTDMDGYVTGWNTAAERQFGYTAREAVGKHVSFIYAPENRGFLEDKIIRPLREKGSHEIEVPLRRKSGEDFVAMLGLSMLRDEQGGVTGMIGSSMDITALREMEKEILRMQKLDSVGILAGGIAHDFNNILTGILGNISLAMLSAPPDTELHQLLSQTESACARARDLTQQLLTFSRGGAPVKRVIAIGRMLYDQVSFALRGSNVRSEFDLPERLWPVEADEGQLGQIVNNLTINAQQAMPGGGVIHVRARNEEIHKSSRSPLPPGKYVRISIEDHGVGIPAKHLDRIFDPYFTTKQKGSGLGLSIAYSIIKNHGGLITVESQAGAGSTFHVFLPANEKALAEREKVERPPAQGAGRILVMDDEALVREVARRMLPKLGYEVVAASNGAEAIALYQGAMKAGSPFDAVIMDLTIPGGMGGKDAIKALRGIDRGVRAIVCSGYSNDPVMAHFRDYGFQAVVAKPFTITQLSEALAQVLRLREQGQERS